MYLGLGAAVLFTYAVEGDYNGLISWFYTFLITVLGAREYARRSLQHPRFLTVVALSFLVISLLGMIEVLDNERNFGTPFGIAADDARYFLQASELLGGERNLNETGLYQALLAVWAAVPSKVLGIEATPLMLFPLNWALAAYVVALCDTLAQRVLGQRPPLGLLAATLLANHRFIDSTIHMYRDGLMLVALLLAFLACVRNRYLRSVLFSIPVALLRLANWGLYVVYFLATIGSRRLRSATFYVAGAGVVVMVILALPFAGSAIFDYASDVTRIGAARLPSYWSFEEQLNFRARSIAGTTVSGTMVNSALKGETVASKAIRPVVFLLFPIRFWPIQSAGMSHSPLASVGSVAEGRFYLNVFIWLSVVAWVMVIPLIVVGFWAALHAGSNERAMCVYYVVALALVSYVSFQTRHALCFIVLHPVFAMHGYMLFRRSRYAQLAVLLSGTLVALAIGAYNYFA